MSNPVPAGERITLSSGTLSVPDRPIIPFIEGDGTGPRHLARVAGGVRRRGRQGLRRASARIAWMEVLAGEKAFKQTKNWLPDETIEAFRTYLVGIKGPLTTPDRRRHPRLNVALRQLLDLYVCLRPVRYFKGVPRPVKHPEKVDMVIFRENTEDIYAGIEFEAGSEPATDVPGHVPRALPEGVQEDSLPAGRAASASRPCRARGASG